MLDIFSSNAAFTVTSMTMALNRFPFIPGRVGQLGLYTPRRLATVSTVIEVKSGRLAFVPSMPRGAPPTQNVEDLRQLIPFLIPHFPLSDTLMADEIQGVRAFGTEDQLEAITTKMDEKLAGMGLKHDVTLEYLRLGGIKGLVITRTNAVTGAPEIAIDMRQAFGLPPKEFVGPPAPGGPPGNIPYDVEWPILMPVDLTDVQGQSLAMQGNLSQLCMDLIRLIADRLGVQGVARIHGLAGANFYDAWIKHPEIRTTFLNQQAANQLRDPQWQTAVTFREVTIEEYRGRVGPVPFVDPNYCYFFPVGVPDLFVEAYAPADYIETVNTIALPRYAKQEVIPFGKGIMVETQQNVLPICSLPDTLITAQLAAFDFP
jgi:hypothetical protein